MGICLTTCNNSTSAVPQSDLFVPSFELNVSVRSQKKKLLKFGSMKDDIILSNKLNKITTEKIIRAKSMIKLKHNSSTTLNSSRPTLPNILKNKFEIENENESLKATDKINTNSNNILTSINNEKKTKENNSGFAKFKTMVKKDSKKKKIENNLNIKYEVHEQVLSSKDEITLATLFLHNYLFHTLDKSSLSYLFKEIKEFQIDPQTTIFFEGDEGSCLFIIKRGEVKLTSNKCDKKLILKEGSIFGELALLKEGILRTYNAEAITNLNFYTIDEISFDKLRNKFAIKTPSEFELFTNMENKEHLEYLTIELELKKGHIITDLNSFFEIKSGEISLCDNNNNEIDVYKNGECFNIKNFFEEFSNNDNIYYSLIKSDNNYRIVTKEDTKCNIFPPSSFIEVYGIDFKNKILFSFFKNTILKDEIFSQVIPKDYINKVFSKFKIEEYKRGAYLLKNKEQKIILIISGVALKHISRSKNIVLKSFDIVGKEFLSYEKSGNIIVNTNHMITLECSYLDFTESILINNIGASKWIDCLREIYLFQHLPDYKLMEIAKNLKLISYKKGDKIIFSGVINEKVYFIINGSAKLIVDGKTFKEFHKGNSFGELFLFNEKEVKSEVICSSNNTKLFYIEKKNFYELMGDSKLNKKTKRKLCLEDIELFPSNLYYLQTLHRGKESNIYLVHNKLFLYIVKAIYIGCYNKNDAKGKFISKLINEKKASKRLDYPLIVKYVKTLKNNNWCFFIEEYINGITLGEYIEMRNPFHDLNQIKFYGANLFLILHNLHQFGIIHRDIKPENLIINEKGYLKLIDFATSKRIKKNITKTIIGTPMFTAPEILKGKGYSYSCDYWSVGIILYYLLYGEYPFGNNAKQPDTIYKEILNRKINIPLSKGDNGNFRKFLEKLLIKDVQSRITSFKQVKESDYFKDYNFDDLKIKKIKAPFIPQVVNSNIEKMLSNLSCTFISYIQKDKVDNVGYSNELNKVIQLDKEVIRGGNEEDSDYSKFSKNWFEDF